MPKFKEDTVLVDKINNFISELEILIKKQESKDIVINGLAQVYIAICKYSELHDDEMITIIRQYQSYFDK